MPIEIERQAFAGMNEVYDKLKSRHLWPVMAVHKAIKREAFHWHRQNNHIFIVEGEAEFFDGDTGESHKLCQGDIAYIPRETLHAIEAAVPVVFIAAFDNPMSMTEFVPYPPAERPPRRP